MLIYLDNCSLNRPFDDQSQTRVRQEAAAVNEIRSRILAGEIDLAWSFIIDLEISKNPFQDRRESAESWRRFSFFEVEPSEKIVAAATALQNIGLSDIDSLHVACAVAAESSYFITTDDGILKKSNAVSGIIIISPIAFMEAIRNYEKRD